MCQGGGANVPLNGDTEVDESGDSANRKVKFEIYSVKSIVFSKKISNLFVMILMLCDVY